MSDTETELAERRQAHLVRVTLDLQDAQKKYVSTEQRAGYMLELYDMTRRAAS